MHVDSEFYWEEKRKRKHIEMNVLQRIRQAIREQKYRISTHANEEMAEDSLIANDVENIILTGEISQKFTHDLRGTRYEVFGEALDHRPAYAVCRFLLSGVLLIITAYTED
ncbi:DUF4258 domain-containing protein [bacterium]|nr:DUF4258 domain-containing protein [bacterium]MCK4436886.1 DUF4258 domain-containing protein [bacterium]